MGRKRRFFTSDTCLKKEDQTWDNNAKVINNPLSKHLDSLDDGDADYDFSIFGQVTKGDEVIPVGMTDNIPKDAVNITQNHLD